jgi:hypothetical protein
LLPYDRRNQRPAGIATAFFIMAAYVEVAGFHYSLKTITAAAGAPLFALGASSKAGGYGGTWIDRLLELVVLFDMLAVAIGGSVSASRGIFAMARDRRLPSPLAITSRKYGSPAGATVFIVGFSLLTLAADLWWKNLFALPATPHYFAIFSWGSTFGGFSLVVVYPAGYLRVVLQGDLAGHRGAVLRARRACRRVPVHVRVPAACRREHATVRSDQEHRVNSGHVLVIGVDGGRYDALGAAPAIRSLGVLAVSLTGPAGGEQVNLGARGAAH